MKSWLKRMAVMLGVCFGCAWSGMAQITNDAATISTTVYNDVGSSANKFIYIGLIMLVVGIVFTMARRYKRGGA